MSVDSLKYMNVIPRYFCLTPPTPLFHFKWKEMQEMALCSRDMAKAPFSGVGIGGNGEVVPLRLGPWGCLLTLD